MRLARLALTFVVPVAVMAIASTCRDSATGPPSRSVSPGLVGQDTTPRVTLAHACGTTFAARNADTTAVVATWTVDSARVGDSTIVSTGTVVLPPRTEERARSETFITVPAHGMVRLRAGGVVVDSAAPEDRPCATRALRGRWTTPTPWPIVAVHLHLLPDGRLLAFGKYGQPQIWNPAAATFTPVPSTSNLFCGGHTLLPDGRIFVAGGHIDDNKGLPDANVFDPATGTWTRLPDMQRGRWYPTATALPNGEVLVVAGNDQTGGNAAMPEIWSPSTGTWRKLTGAVMKLPYYPRLFVAPNGKVFYAGEQSYVRWLDWTGSGRWSAYGSTADGAREYGSSVMYDDGKIISMGGHGRYVGQVPKRSAEVIDLNKTSYRWRLTSPMFHARRQLNATLLPNGRVFVSGGTNATGFDNPAGAVYAAEEWDPVTESWTLLASNSVPRLYHSVTILLPDGRVLSAGGGDANATTTSYRDANYFEPAYLFKPTGEPADRPTISAAPAVVGYGQTFRVRTPDRAAIRQVRWIRLGSVTHAFDESQRGNTLHFAPAADGVNVSAPANANLAPPGHYLLFVMDQNGVPSVGAVVRVR
ncbi:MAG TPA: galactose oxidase-like domain-containing protein [Gemmatimonadaceae bacterium]|nr:galactose oxidase-like domain-containing protein [Gemmatimonadaceae bacterium]